MPRLPLFGGACCRGLLLLTVTYICLLLLLLLDGIVFLKLMLRSLHAAML